MGRRGPPLAYAEWVDAVWMLRGLALLAFVGLPLYAWRVRGRRYAIFGLVILAFSLPGALVTHARLSGWLFAEWRPWVDLAFAYSLGAAGLHLAHLVRARLRARPFRVLVSVPGQAFLAAGFLAGLWLLLLLPFRLALGALGFDEALRALRWLDLVPFAVAGFSIFTSITPGRLAVEWVRVYLGADGPAELQRIPVERYRRRPPPPLAQRPLRIVQISDPHLGPWQSVARLRRTIQVLLEHDPDLVLLTGDFLTMEGAGSRGALSEALAPLRPVSGRCYAVFGNHDHESLEEVRGALEDNGVRLLVDEEALARTAAGEVQLVGADWVARGRREHIQSLLARFPRRDGCPRLLMLHDPLSFHHVPVGDVDLTLSGHTHGGQLGLVSFGLDWTVLSRSRWPDHGLFAHGSNRLYVHRGTGFYGFPLRVGVPGEFSVLEWVTSH